MKKVNFNLWTKNYLLFNPVSPLQTGSVIPGCNGLYRDPETHYRNSCHWAVICKYVLSNCQCNESEERLLINFIEDVVEDLLGADIDNGPVLARMCDKDKSNGLIGSAWIIESLSFLLSEQKVSIKEKSKVVIKKLLSHYSFDCELGYWPNVIEPSGRKIGIDRTFNHQLWLTVSQLEAAHALGDALLIDEAKEHVSLLLNRLRFNLSGYIYHTLGAFPHYHRTLAKRILKPQYKSEMHIKESGYHAFNVLALSKLSYLAPELFEKNNKIQKALAMCKREAFWKKQINNPYSTPYNPTGLEVAVAASHIGDSKLTIESLNFHFSQCFRDSQFVSDFDNATLNARFYEACFIAGDYADNLIFSGDRWELVR